MTNRSGIFALIAALAIVLPFVGLLVTSPSGAVGTGTATVTITGNPNPGTPGSITYDVTVAPVTTGDTTPTGSVDVADGAGGTCSIAVLDNTGAGSCSITESASVSPYTVIATYNGDPIYAISAGNVMETVNLADQATLSVTSTSGTYGTPLTLTTSGGSGTGAVSYAVVDGSASGCAISSGQLTSSSAGTCLVTATKAADATYSATFSVPTTVTLAKAAQATLAVTSTSGIYGTALTLTTSGGSGTGAVSYTVVDGSASGCAISSGQLTSSSAGTCLVTATKAADATYSATSSVTTTVTLALAGQAALTVTSISGTYGTALTLATSGGSGTGAVSYTVAPGTASGCATSSGQLISTSTGTCLVTATKAADANYSAISSAPTTVTLAQAIPTAPTITNVPTSAIFGGGLTATVSTNGDGTKSVTSTTPTVCSTNGLAVSYVGVGTCSLSAQVAAGSNYLAGSGAAQTFTIGRAAATTPIITNVPSPANEFFGFTPIVGTTGDGTTSVTSSTPNVCSVGTNGLTVTFVGFGACTLTPSVAQGANYFGATGSPRTFSVQEASHGYWLVGSDGGIFSFGSAAFHGSTGGTPLQRPVMAITPTSTGNGYWLVASDGGIFSFGDSTYYGSLPGLGFHPAGSGLPQSLNAPIVGMVPTFTGHGYFMVASDGGVFAFGDAKFEGSCPGIGGCAGRAVAVMPDSTGKGYWLVTNVGGVYAFGDASFYGTPPAGSVPVVGAVATSDGHGYWLLYANGVVSNFGDAVNYGAPVGYVNGFNPATTIFPTLDNKGYWVASARGDVFAYGDSPYLGSMAAAGLNGEIIGAFGF
jgi:hypothetical protein